MRIDSSGNIGIGTDTPKRKLSVHESAAASCKIQITNGTTGIANDGAGFQLGIGTDGTANIEQREDADLVFHTDNNERMRIDSSGRVGINETSVSSTNSNMLEVKSSAASVTSAIRTVNKDTTAGTAQGAALDFGLSRNSGAYKPQAGKIAVGREHDWTADDTKIDAFMSFSVYQNNALNERMRIDSSGDIGIGTSSPSTTLHLATSSPVVKLEDTDATGTPQCEVSGAGGDLILRVDKDDEKSSSIFVVQIDGSNRIIINSNGAVNFSGDYGSLGDVLTSQEDTDAPIWDIGGGESDSRLKENVKEFKALDLVNKLRPVEFDWNDKAIKKGHDFGLIAQEVESVLPKIVKESRHTGYKKLAYEELVPFLVQSVKELTEENKALRERLDAIEQKVQPL